MLAVSLAIHAAAFPTSITSNYRAIVTVRWMINAFSPGDGYSILFYTRTANNVTNDELLAAYSFNLINDSEHSLIFHLQ